VRTEGSGPESAPDAGALSEPGRDAPDEVRIARLEARLATLERGLELDLRHATQLRALSRVYLGVAHDLRAPLNAITLNFELLKRSLALDEGSDDPQAPRRQQWMRVLEEEFARLARTLDLLLAQTAPGSSDPRRHDLRDVLARVESLVNAQARQQRARVRVTLPGTPVWADGDPEGPRLALLNVVVNALDAIPEGGRVDLALAVENDHAVIRVQDNGPGIDPALAGRLFELHVTTKPHASGAGLHVARMLIERAGGTLALRETGPPGTTFELRLPAIPG
jgi:signal transduction histidine kinase